jgi:hypothetical protein
MPVADADFALLRGLIGIGGQETPPSLGARDQRIVAKPGAGRLSSAERATVCVTQFVKPQ